MTKHIPKGGQCLVCVHRYRNCSELDFSTMPQISSFASYSHNYVIVRCTDYSKSKGRGGG